MERTLNLSIDNLAVNVKQGDQTGFEQLPQPLAADVRRFWSKVQRSDDPEACWLWVAQSTVNGYGCYSYGSPVRFVVAHRFSWLLAHGEIPAGLCVLHRCDVKRCVNPAHLWLGTRADNTYDMIAKGRAAWQRQATRDGGDAL